MLQTHSGAARFGNLEWQAQCAWAEGWTAAWALVCIGPVHCGQPWLPESFPAEVKVCMRDRPQGAQRLQITTWSGSLLGHSYVGHKYSAALLPSGTDRVTLPMRETVVLKDTPATAAQPTVSDLLLGTVS